MQPLLSKAHNDALAFAISTAYPSESTIKALLAKAHGAMLGVAGRAGNGADDELKEMLGIAAETTEAAKPEPVEEASSTEEEDEDEKETESNEDEVSDPGA